MKKVLSICAVILSVGYAQAQTSAGGMMIGGGLSIESGKQEFGDDELKNSQFTLTPSFGYFVSDGFAVGLNLGFSSAKEEDFTGGDIVETTTSGFVIEPFARYYKFTSNDKFAFYLEGGIGIGSFKQEDDDIDEEQKQSSLSVRVSPGFAYFFNEKWALDLQLAGISYVSQDPNTDSAADNDKITNFTFGADSFNPTLGFRYFFGN